MLNSNAGTLPVSIPIGVGNGGGFGNGNGFDDIIALAIIAMIFGNGNGGIFGGYGGGNGGASAGYVLQNDFATIQRLLSDGFGSIDKALDAQNNGICNLGYTQLQQTNQLAEMISNCCCQTQQNIKDTQYAIATTGAGIQSSIKDCCCENEKIAMQNRYEAAQNQCATLQAIDKLGDRIIDYMSADKAQALRDENQALRLAASQQAQNNYLIGQLRPAPVPAFPVPSPFYYGNVGFGTTIA